MKLKYGPYSPSRLNTAICGYAFHKQYVAEDRKRPPENLAAARGSVVHEVFEQITQKIIKEPGYMFNEKQIREWVTESVGNHPSAYQAVEEIIEMVKLYIQCPPPELVSDAEVELKLAVKAVEKDGKLDFEQCDYDDPQAFVRGKADILMISDDTIRGMIYDHKTQPNIEDADTFQLGTYAWLIHKAYPFLQEVHTILHFARYGKYSEPHVWTKEDLMDIEDALVTRIMIVENRQSWEATPHSHCQYCSLVAECPVMGEYVEMDDDGKVHLKNRNFKILGDTQKAVKMAGLLNVLEEAIKEVKKNLKEHVTSSGTPIAIHGKVYEFRADQQIHWDKLNKSEQLREQTYKIFEKYGLDPKDFMGFSQTYSTGVWRIGEPEFVQALSELFPRRVQSRFGGYKA